MWKLNITKGNDARWNVTIFQPKLTIFLQGLQGNGKTTIAKTLCERNYGWRYIEQDQYYGDTRKCQQGLIELLKSDAQVVIVSRCNVNTQQYRRYLEISLNYGEVLFLNFTDTNYNSKTSLMLARSIAGVLNRSESTENVVFGPDSVLIDDAIQYTRNNMKYWSPNKKAVNIPILHHDQDITSEIENSDSLKDFVISNTERIMSLSIPLLDIISNIEYQISHISRKNIITKNDYKNELLKKTIFISLSCLVHTQKTLMDFPESMERVILNVNILHRFL